MQTVETAALLDTSLSIAAPLFSRYQYPWALLPHLESYIQSLFPALDDGYMVSAPDVYIHRTASVAASASLQGPLIVGPDVQIRHNAYLRGSVILDAGAVVGNATEVKNAVFLPGANAPHFNYVGDSVLGVRAHLGAGVICSNLRLDRQHVVVHVGGERVETGLRKFGAIVGDHAEIGCHCVLNPGTCIARGVHIAPLTAVRGYIPAPQPDLFKKENG